MRSKRITIEQDVNSIRNQMCDLGDRWSEAQYVQSFHTVDVVDGKRFSAILVEFKFDKKYEYIEIEAVETSQGWRIVDDLNFRSYRDANQEFINKRKAR